MKKIMLFSFFVLSSAMMTAFTADSISDIATTQNINTNDTGGKGIPPAPKPPGTGTGTGG
jgi:hypothetical protein